MYADIHGLNVSTETSVVSEKITEFEVVRQKIMNSGNYSDDDVDTRARDVAKKAVLRNLEDKMEILFCTIQRKQKDIVNLAGTCSWNSDVLIKHAYFLVLAKQRSKLRDSIAKDKHKMSVIVSQYNSISDSDNAVLLEHCLEGDFSWRICDLGGMYFRSITQVIDYSLYH